MLQGRGNLTYVGVVTSSRPISHRIVRVTVFNSQTQQSAKIRNGDLNPYSVLNLSANFPF